LDFDAAYEDAVLGESLRDESFLKRAARVCQQHHFATKERAWLWGIIHDNWTKYHERTSGKIVATRARRDFGKADKRRPYLLLARKVFRTRVKDPHAVLEELERFVRHVNVQLAIEESATLLEKGKIDDAEQAIAKASRGAARQRNYTHISWIEGFAERQAQRKYEREHPDEFTTIPLGFPRIDKTLSGGGRKGELALIMGTTGRGKSIFLTNAAHAAVSRGYKAIVFGFEMPARQMAARQDARWSGLQYTKFKGFDFKPSELRRLRDRLKKARRQFKNRLHIVSMPVRSANILDVRNAIEDIREEHGFQADAIFLDSADHLRALDTYGGNFRLQQAEVYWAAKELAEEDGYFVMSSTHAGREWATKVATAEATSESYDKSRIADMVLSLNDPSEMKRKGRKTVIADDDDFEDDEDGDELDEPKAREGARLMELYLGKYRDGDSRFTVNVECDFACMTMQELKEGDSHDDDDFDDSDDEDELE
jgi:replicative DNA helicase